MIVKCNQCGHAWNYRPKKPTWKRTTNKVQCPKCHKCAFRVLIRPLKTPVEITQIGDPIEG